MVRPVLSPAERDLKRLIDARTSVSVSEFGAVGDGTTDNTSAFQAAIDAIVAAGGGCLQIPAGDFAVDGPLIYSQNSMVFCVDAYGATITHTGSGNLWELSSTGSHPSWDRPHFYGGTWVGSSSSVSCFKLTDVGGAFFRDLTIRGFSKTAASGGYGAFWLRNYAAWSENQSFIGLRFHDCARVATYQGAAETGGSGTASFARARWHDVFVNGGDDYWFYCSSGVYDSYWSQVGGNCSDTLEAVFYWSGAGTSTVSGLKVEGGSTSGDPAFPTALVEKTGTNGLVLFDFGTREQITTSKTGTTSDLRSTQIAGGIAVFDGSDQSIHIVRADGIGLFGSFPVNQRTVTGSTSDEVLTSLLTALVQYGLCAVSVTPEAASWTAWSSPTFTGITVGNGTVSARYRLLDGTLHWHYQLVLGSTSAVGTNPKLSTPSGWKVYNAGGTVQTYALGKAMAFDSSAGTFFEGGCYGSDSTDDVLTTRIIFGSTTVTAAAPFTWASGDILVVSGTCEVEPS